MLQCIEHLEFVITTLLIVPDRFLRFAALNASHVLVAQFVLTFAFKEEFALRHDVDLVRLFTIVLAAVSAAWIISHL